MNKFYSFPKQTHLHKLHHSPVILNSIKPENVVYQGPTTTPTKRVTLKSIRKKYEAGEKLTMVTAYDYPSAVHVDQAGIDLTLVGDSVAMVVHGYDTTLPLTLDEMLMHCRAVNRGSVCSFLIGDLPFGTYEMSERDAVISAVRLMKEGGMDAVKMEGASPQRIKAVKAIIDTGIAVMGHVGLTPQRVSVIGGFRPQAQVADEALKVIDEAKALEEAGCFAIVLECIPAPIAMIVTRMLDIPTIGIGAGPHCSGQVLVFHDLLGMMSHPHHAKVTPKFCKQFAQVGQTIQGGLQAFKEEVEGHEFPSQQYTRYRIKPEEIDKLCMELNIREETTIANEMKQVYEQSKQ